MYQKLIYFISLVLVLSLAGRGWPKASNPAPPDGDIHEDSWVNLSWRPGLNAVSFDIYIGENYEDVKNGTGSTFQRNQNSSFFVVGFPGFPYPNGLVPGTTYYWRVDEINYQYPDRPLVGDVWSFTITPSRAHNPEPADRAVSVIPNVTLSWEPGYHARLHTVYFGDNFEGVNNASGGRPQGTATYSPGLLVSGKTYYWRVDEFDGRETYRGNVWSFTVGPGGPGEREGNFYVDAVQGNDNNSGTTSRMAFATIQKGIEAAADGQVVLVYPGLYWEEINFMGKTITVQGVAISPAGLPVIWNPDDFAVSFYYGEGPESILKNFIIRDSFMGVFIVDSSPTINNLTVTGNKYGIEAYANSDPDIRNTILWNNTDSDLFGCRATFSCVERGGEGNITADPLFVDPDNGDYHLRSERGRYWPEHDIWVLDKITSPCIDGGDPHTAVSDEPMPNGGRINIGAYGGTTEASLSPGEGSVPSSGKASNPYPADGAEGVGMDVTLNWTAGINTVFHDVYFGPERNAVENADTSDTSGIYQGRQTATSYTLLPSIWRLPYYYWRIDEIDSDGNITRGDVWTFSPVSPPPPKGRACFVGDTPVWADGKLVRISKVAAGQTAAKVTCPVTVSRQIEKLEEHEGTFTCYDVLLQSGNRISVAENHYFLSESGDWTAVQNLRTAAKLQTQNGLIEIVNVTKRLVPYKGKVYNLKIAGSDRYLAGKDAVIVRDY